jgi:hypothetical protein
VRHFAKVVLLWVADSYDVVGGWFEKRRRMVELKLSWFDSNKDGARRTGVFVDCREEYVVDEGDGGNGD